MELGQLFSFHDGHYFKWESVTPVKYKRCGFNRYFDELEIIMNDALNRWFQVPHFNMQYVIVGTRMKIFGPSAGKAQDKNFAHGVK